ncbi:MAG: GNAT family N-acetyltransferase [Acidobacteriaceae bacterium]|nr:GNAT family N-acetyltransferase [Acidobacteriaceae bacterium]MBV9764087.1 GNAT family N-acetyltransferase [Acidobacteriaceae bacterium]
MRTPFVIGQQVYIRGLERADLEKMVGWINDEDVTRLLFMGLRPANIELLAEQWQQDQRNQNEVAFAVCDKQSDAFIGTTGLYSINWVMRSAEFRVFLGEKEFWNRGVGTECTRLMTVYGFEKLNLNKVWLGVNADNVGGARAYTKAGFVREGILRQEQYRNFRYYDVIRMSLLRSEYEQLRNTKTTETTESGA